LRSFRLPSPPNDWDDDWGFGYNPGFVGFGYSRPVAYYGGYAPAYGYYGPRYYAPPVYRVVRRPVGPVVVSRPVYPYARPIYYAPRPIVRTTRIVTVPRYVTRTRIVTVPRRVVTVAPVAHRTRVVRRVYY
jgi:hypothetical protein